jgi:hypothetical protein
MRDMVNERFDKKTRRFIMGDEVKDLFGSSGKRIRSPEQTAPAAARPVLAEVKNYE